MSFVTSFLISSVLVTLRKLATQELFEYLFIATAEAAAKSTKTTWDDEFVDRMREALKK